MLNPFPNGTKRKIGQHTVYLPPVGYVPNIQDDKPEELIQTNILFEDQHRSQQIWRKPELPSNWKKLRSEEDANKKLDPKYVNPICETIRRREWSRRYNGVWCKIDGEYVYLTGLHYYYLAHTKHDFGYPDFRFVDTKVFYLLQLADEDEKCYGTILATLRRFGKTAILGTWMLDLPTRRYNCYAGLQSKTGDDAKKVFDLSIVNVWRNLVDFFKPVYDYNSGQKKQIDFLKPTVKGRRGLTDEVFESDELQSKILYKNTVANAFDGWKLHRAALEEPGKWEEESIYKTWKIIKPCLLVKGEIVGKAFLPTTINEMTKGGDDYKKLWDESDSTKRNKNGRTTSGLYRLFIPADEGYKFDKFGRSLVKESREEILNEREALQNDSEALSEYIRQYPLDEDEAFRFGGAQCLFNRMVLDEAITNCQINKDQWIRTGRFDWQAGIKDGKAVWFDDPNGFWQVSWLFDDPNDSNKIIRKDSAGKTYFYPNNTIRFSLSLDPVSHAKLVNPEKGSLIGATVFRKFDAWADPDHNTKYEMHNGNLRPVWDSYNFIADYKGRREDLDECHEEIICACVYFGCMVLGESQKNSWMNYMERRGYGAFIMNRPTEASSTQGNQNTQGVPSSQPFILNYTSKIKTFVQHHGHRVRHERILKDWMAFDMKNTQKYDLAVASGINLVAIDQPVVEKAPVVNAEEIFTFYDQSGEFSS